MIPFTNEGAEYFHCTGLSTECQTTSGAMSKCATGSFLYLRSPDSNYSVTASFPSIKNTYKGDMILRVYALVVCHTNNQEDCTADAMTLVIESGDSFIFTHEYPYSSFEFEKRWLKFELKFVAHGFDINVC